MKYKIFNAINSLDHNLAIPPLKACLEVFVLTLVLFSVLRPITNFFCFSIFTERDINRIYDLIDGYPVWHGPELSWGGFTPGSFFYFYLSPSVYFAGLNGYVNHLLISFCLGAALLWSIIKHITDYLFAFIILVFFILSPAGIAAIRPAWNPSFLAIFWIILGIFTYHLRSRKIISMTIIGCYFLIVGLAAQIHIMSISWILIFLIFADHINLKKTAIGILITALTFLPYFLWHFKNLEKFPLTNPINNPLNSVTYNLSFFLGSMHDFKKIALVSISNFPKLITLNLLILFLWIFALTLFNFFIDRDRRYIKDKSLLLALVVLSVLLSIKSIFNISLMHYLIPTTYFMLAFIIAVYSSLSQRSQRFSILYLSIGLMIGNIYDAFTADHFNSFKILPDIFSQEYFFSIFLMLSTIAILRVLKNMKFILTCIFSILFLIPAVQVFQFKSTAIPALITNLTSTKICKDIFDKTSWDFEEYKRNTMLLGTWTGASLSATCQDTYLKRGLTTNAKKHSGVIVIKSSFLESILLKSVEKPNWLGWIENGKLDATEISYVAEHTLIYYKSRFENIFNIQNVGENYPTHRSSLNSKIIGQHYEIVLDGLGQIYLIYDAKAGTIGLHGSGTSRFYTVGPTLFLEKIDLHFLCDKKLLSLTFPHLGYSVNDSKSFKIDLDYLLKEVFLTPIEFQNYYCENFRPLRIHINSITSIAGPGSFQTIRNFKFNFGSR